MQNLSKITALLEWQVHMGVDEAIGDTPINLLQAPKLAIITPPAAQPLAAISSPPPVASASLASTIAQAQALADAATSLSDLRDAIMHFDGCSIKKTARNTVFADGNPNSDIMILGEAPDVEEDRQGIPFCGTSGQLLDAMLASIGLNRTTNCYLANSLFWRPPGNRQATPEEIAICKPFLKRHIELFSPKLLIFMGAFASKSLLDDQRSIAKLRGLPLNYNDIPVSILFHPSYLLREPLQKKLAWKDLLEIQKVIKENDLLTV